MRKYLVLILSLSVVLLMAIPSANAATRYAVASGDWSDTSNVWSDTDGGAAGNYVPGDGDTFVILAGVSVKMNQDQSAWTGLAGANTIRGGATPGMLYFSRGDSGYLKLASGATLVGTTETNRGRLLANADGAWDNATALPYDNKAVIDLQGTSSPAKIVGTNLDIKFYATAPSNPSVEVYGTVYTVTAEADDDKITFSATPSTTPPLADMPIVIEGADVPEPLVSGTTYYIRDISGATCKLSATYGGDAIDLTDDGSGTIYAKWGKFTAAQATNVNTTTGVVTWNGTAPADGTPVVIKSSGTLPTGWSSTAVYYTRAKSANTCKLALQNSDATIVIPSAVGSGTLSMYAGSYSSSAYATTAVNVIENVTSDTPWVTTDDHDRVVLVDAGAPSDYDQQRLGLATIGASTIVLSAAVDSVQYPGAKIYSISRNVSVRSTGTSSSASLIEYSTASTHGGVFGGEIRNVAGSGTTFYGNGIYYGSGHTISGTISGNSYSFRDAVGYITATRGASVAYSFFERGVVGQKFRISAEEFDGAANTSKVFDNTGDIVKTACDGGTADYPDEDPDGGSGYAIQATTLQNNISAVDPLYIISDRSPHRIWLTAGTWTITYKIYSTFNITDNNLVLTARYISSASPRTITTSTDSQAIAAKTTDTDWTQTLAITVTTAADGWVDLDMYLLQYQNGGNVFVWPTPTVTVAGS